jgi:hypothetical protein
MTKDPAGYVGGEVECFVTSVGSARKHRLAQVHSISIGGGLRLAHTSKKEEGLQSSEKYSKAGNVV